VHIREACPGPKVALKLILETSQLSKEQIVGASVLAWRAGWEWIKTSTGYVGGGATRENVAVMVGVSRVLGVRSEQNEGEGKGPTGGKMRVKASGGVRSWKSAVEMIGEGAERIGTSSGIEIVQESTENVDKHEITEEKRQSSTVAGNDAY